jgi:hypothetical protein
MQRNAFSCLTTMRQTTKLFSQFNPVINTAQINRSKLRLKHLIHNHKNLLHRRSIRKSTLELKPCIFQTRHMSTQQQQQEEEECDKSKLENQLKQQQQEDDENQHQELHHPNQASQKDSRSSAHDASSQNMKSKHSDLQFSLYSQFGRNYHTIQALKRVIFDFQSGELISKQCTKCSEWLEPNQYSPDIKGFMNLYSQCKKCKTKQKNEIRAKK